MLSEGAEAHSVPNLEILANDVRCGHGSAVGPLDDEQRYYLMSRGLDRARADRLQVKGFFEEVLARFPHQGLEPPLRKAVMAKYAGIMEGAGVTERIRVAALADLPDGRGVRVEVAGHRIAVFRVGDDVYAIGDRCSHAEASLAEGEVFDGAVECPRHGSEFDLTTGEPGSFPATKPVAGLRRPRSRTATSSWTWSPAEVAS